MIIKMIPVGMMGVNCYIVGDKLTKKGAVIDPGAEGSKIIEEIKKEDINVEYILLTHGHFDHIGAVKKVKEFTKAKVIIHEEGKAYLNNPDLNLSGVIAHKGFTEEADETVINGEKINIGNLEFEIIHTPGHTLDGLNYYEKNNRVLFSGDNLFRESIGRTDFPKGDMHSLITTIKERLFNLPEDVVVYPGHGEMTTIGYEKSYNPYTSGSGWDE
ncbi:MAG: MBL fold metallo-hydrolase [Epulopiscium sp.]|nr:MBL fold metallo-hydrolase [Candidatus Epulonipiscium sp.]